MTQYVGCDMHKRYSVFVLMDKAGNTKPAIRVDHDRDQGSVSTEYFLLDLGPAALEKR
ncbi:hypothetical protein HYR54_06760 [Candidatus Acetothermia bacterium]|nr:hypothetical protein [Candidatus Acetothermia bacterium]